MLNGEERFVVMSVSRNDIAAMINDVIDEKQIMVPKFNDGDPRLTSHICGELADGLADVYGQSPDEEDLGYEEREVVCAIIYKHFR